MRVSVNFPEKHFVIAFWKFCGLLWLRLSILAEPIGYIVIIQPKQVPGNIFQQYFISAI